ncbi:DHA2 family efflux MFS transporter permease subunit [Marihabitans asiaticum]|uniref:EmrB/QacA subfamily drug resistance transporter n=1 Tax=Marihabitans asiaticum TaxID=415218 RepID=A0A560WA96_9MICO|nr:DHA2 family efflux MFS transporter permease subunit [Marihabitans asiaticum]TWD14551.1 EmrB/QacA subfamily drug resistance transporter [Marihabitans asiaticum]
MASPERPGRAASADPSADPRRWWALAVLAAGLSMIVLDGTIVAIALPTIITELDLDLTDAQWVGSLYAVVFAALLLSFGRLGDRLGRRRVFAVGVATFVLASVLAGSADSAGTLIAARALQGVGGAMVLPASLSSVNATFRGRDRAAAFGVWGAVMAGMAAVGPLLGGWLATAVDWRWIFYVNVPLGAAVFVGTFLVVPETKGAGFGRGIDVDGLLTSSIGFGLLVFGLIEGSDLGWWKPQRAFTVAGVTWPADAPVSPVPVSIALGLAFIGLFLLWERHRARVARSAILDLELFRHGTFSWGNLTAMTVAVGEFALVFVLPLFLVNALGLTVMQAGWVLAAMAIGAFVAGAQARHLAARMGPPGVVVLGLALEVIGVAATAFVVRPDASPLLIAAAMVVYGVGLGLASAQLTSTVLADVPPEESGSGSATQSTVRQVGSALGSALAGSVLAAGLAHSLPSQLAEVGGLPPDVADGLESSTSASAGGVIRSLAEQGTAGRLGEMGPQVVDALAAGFADATRVVVLAATGCLALGLVGAVQVARAARSAQATDGPGQPKD